MRVRHLPNDRLLLDCKSWLRHTILALVCGVAAGCLLYTGFSSKLGRIKTAAASVEFGLLLALVIHAHRNILLDRRNGTITSSLRIAGRVSFRLRTYQMADVRAVGCELADVFVDGSTYEVCRSRIHFENSDCLIIEEGSSTRFHTVAEDAQRIARYCGVRFGG